VVEIREKQNKKTENKKAALSAAFSPYGIFIIKDESF